VEHGNSFYVCVDCESRPEIERLLRSIGEGGQVETELQDMFWGDYFGTLTDRFGIAWMFSFKPPKQA
jgi:PhnB protein